jgi:cytochrome bd-type quinol oxidase subunit 2
LYRQARLLGVLLILQVVVMVGIGVWLFSTIDWDRVVHLTNEQGQVHLNTIDGPLLKRLEQASLFVVYFLAPAILLLLAGLGFVLLRRRRGWMLASVAQALIMLACLFFYGASRPWFAYPLIAYCIVMILLLNSRSVQAVVHRKRVTPQDGRSELAHGE